MANILLVDDSRTSRKLLKSLLEADGHTIVGEAGNGEEGFIKYKELKPDITTMDITMPVLDGIEALRLIMDYDENAKVIMVTAAGQKHKLVDAVKFGAKEFLTKPFEPEEITKTIAKLTEA